MMKVYLDNGATTKVDDKVVEEMNKYYLEKYGNASSLHGFGKEAKDGLDKAREIITKRINANLDQIIFTGSGSEADNLAIKGVAYKKGKGHLITSRIEHHAIIETFKALQKKGFEVTFLNVDENGFVDLEQLERSIRKDTILVSIMHANNEIGTIQDLSKIGEICKKRKVLFHSDAVQSFCKLPIDVKKMNVDFLSFSAHKIHGPKGVGALFIKDRKSVVKEIYGGHQEFDLRAGTENIPGIVGFAKAVELMREDELGRMRVLRDKIVKGILEIKNTRINGDLKKRLVNNVNASFSYIEGESLLLSLDDRGVAVSTGSACSSASLDPSHVLLAIGLKHEEAHGSIRFTLSRYTTEEEIKYTLQVLKEEVQKLRKISPFGK